MNFSDYLNFVITDPRYCERNSFYTETDALLKLEPEIAKREERNNNQPERLPVLEMLRKYGLGEQLKHLLLAGKPGFGKSTTLWRLCVEIAEIALNDDLQPIPVFIELKSDKPILKLIQAEFRRAKLRVTEEQVDDWLIADKLVLLLDGVNEIPSDKLRGELQSFRENNLTTPMIFTTRDLMVGGTLGIDKQLEMSPLTPLQIPKLVYKYLPEHGDKLLLQLRDRLKEIAETPLLLKMLCEVFDPETEQIPQNKAGLFELFDRKYQIHKEGVLISADSRRFQSDILEYLAFTMLQGDTEKPTEAWLTLSRSRAEGIIEAWLKQRGETNPASKAKEWLKDLEHHLLQVAADTQQIEFHHQLFQEYYAARHLRSMLQDNHPDLVDDDRFKHFYLNYLKWTEPLGFLLGLLDDKDRVIRLVNLGLEVDLVLGSRLAGQVKLEFQSRFIEDLNAKELPIWLKIYLLGCTGSKEAKIPLLDFLKSNDLDVAIKAVSALEELNDIQIVPALKTKLERLEKRVKPDDSLGDRHWMTPASTYLILSEQAVELEVEITKILLELSLEDIKPVIDEYLENSNTFLDYLFVSNDMKDIVVQYAKRSQENIEEKLLQGLFQSININDSSRANQFANILAAIKSEKASSILVYQLNSIEDSQHCTAIINQLGKFDNEESLKALTGLLVYSDIKIRVEAAQTLAKNKRLNAIPFLEPILQNQDFDIRWRISILLAELGAEIAIEVLEEGLKHEDPEFRSQSAKSLGTLTSSKINCLLVKALADPIYYVRRSAAIALAKFGAEEAIPELLKALRYYYPDDPTLADAEVEFELSEEDKTENKKGFTIKGFDSKAIGELGDYSAIKQWVDEWRTRSIAKTPIVQEVVEALSKFDTDAVREKLHESLLQGEQVAAFALSQFGDVEMVPYLIEMLGSDQHSLDYLDRASILLANLIDGAQEDAKRDSLISTIISHLNAPGIDKNYYFRNRLAIVLIRVNSLHVAKYLTELMTLLDTKSGKQALWVIESVQYNYKLYNYNILCIPPASQRDKIEGNKTQHHFPNVTEVKIFEKVDRYYQTPPSSSKTENPE
jgi:HEAT repeat protein